MSIQYKNGFSAYQAGYARHANPVAYIVEGELFSVQSKRREEWFDGWDAAQAAK